MANRIMSKDEAETYLKSRNEFINAPDDSIKNALISDISYYFYKQDDSIKFREWNKYFYTNSKNQENKSGIAESNWDLGNFLYRKNILDSSYYHYNLSYEQYLEVNKKLMAGRMLLNMAIIQERVKDYIGSENTTFQALDLIKDSSAGQKFIYSAYNNLGIIYNGLEDYSKAREYHGKALSFAESLQDPVKFATSLNNIGVVHQKLEDHNRSKSNFSQALALDSLYEKESRVFAMLTDNLGYAEFKLGNYKDALFLFHKSLKIRDSIEHQAGIVINKLHLGEYYMETGDTLKALRYTKEANSLANSTRNNRDLLASYRLLSKIEPQKAPNYLDSYIHLNDSLLKEERAIQNKFARIRYETDQFITRADNLNQQKTYLIVGIILILILFFLTYIIQLQNSRNKKLVLEKQQQDSNERIYDLLLNSQQKYEEGSITERKRISRDLHDSVLSKFFGIRINLEVLNNKTGKDSEKKRSMYLESLQGIENEIRNISHKLNADSVFSEIGFQDILKDLFLELEESDKLKIKFSSGREINWNAIKNNLKINFYRIIQESLQNIRKHAKAKNVGIRIDFEEDYLILHISDDGQGFDVKNKEKGIGLKNIRERVTEIQGKFDIISNENGTILIVSVPKEEVYDGYYKSFNGR
ncbi:sensor histidine kinase [Salegentibacter sp. LM13S]|uniref:tetratricopeptide repeat-containing sensor histidine kinase n=1 Tax=Salegentibacter lacus TaxID=2873599 RepID=UPI001CC9FC21|nr:tetratricopeptide repeat protein [Salegentibacter lacus]MBZ9629714.1 sensor histidine kinase [Salegentibacter lacus]